VVDDADGDVGHTSRVKTVDLDRVVERLAPAGVTGVRSLPGGASSLTYLGLRDGRRVVVKVAPAGVMPILHRDVLRQARMIRALAPTDVPVPEVLWEDVGAPPDEPPMFVMSYAEGMSIEPLFDLEAPALDPGDVAARMRDAARALAVMHRLDPSTLGLGAEPEVSLDAEVERWCALLRTVDPELVPSWETTADRLRAAMPTQADAAIVHGDFRLGNLLVDQHGIAAVVDWEIWSIGDPRVDLGWFLLNADPETYRRPTAYVGLTPTVADLAGLYAETFGSAPKDLDWFRALASFKSAATWSLIVKHNRRRPTPDPDYEAIAPQLPTLLERARALAG
jgi:aminoglycoside phosphotransferase (APT) family kinase protein